MPEKLEVRAERPEDVEAVRHVNEAAFGRTNEAELVDILRGAADPIISLVATVDEQVAGHILFTPVTVESEGASCAAMGLAPMAVHPRFQRQGIGSRLVQHGLQAVLAMGYPVVVVLGHPSYYPRFGFRPAREKGLRCAYPVPEEVFMVAELKEGALQGCTGIVHYLPEFALV